MSENRRNGTLPSVTARKKRMLLVRLAEHGDLRRACEEADVAIRTTRYWRAMDEAFSDAYDQAKDAGEAAQLAEYEALMHERIKAGVKDPGSTLLTMFRVKRLDPKYRENATINMQVHGPTAITFTGEDGQPLLSFAPPRPGTPVLRHREPEALPADTSSARHEGNS